MLFRLVSFLLRMAECNVANENKSTTTTKQGVERGARHGQSLPRRARRPSTYSTRPDEAPMRRTILLSSFYVVSLAMLVLPYSLLH